MNYIVFDLEFNQGYKSIRQNKNTINPKCPFEIIQIGAVKLDENFDTISVFDRFIKPQIYDKIHPLVKKLTGITMEDLNTAGSFQEVYKDFIEFLQSDKNVLCVWGAADVKELFRNIQYYGLDIAPISKEYINVQQSASKYFDCPQGTNIGLSNAVELLNIPLKDEFHNAFNDAYYTAEIFKKVFTDKIKTKIYNPYKPTPPAKSNNEKVQVDTCKLIKQFEKMFNREMTDEEQSIIKLAYIMGKTNQFQGENLR